MMTTLRTGPRNRLRQLCKRAKDVENPRELARLLKEIDDGLSELDSELRDILEEVESVIRTKRRWLT